MNNVRTWMLLPILGIMILVLVACAAPAPEAAPAAEEAASSEDSSEMAEAAEPSERCGDPEQLDDTLNFYNWADYIDENIITMFEEECGVEVNLDLYTSNEEAIAKIQAGNSGYDLSIPTDYAAKILIDEGLVQALNMDAIPNAANLDPASMGMYYDPENTYSLPYAWSTTGIAYNTTYFDEAPTSYASLFDLEQVCANSGFVSMLNDERETVGMALQSLGHSANETDPAAHDEALALLQAQKDCIAGYNSENFIQTLAAEEVVMAGSWGFAAALSYLDNENIRYFIPEEGGIIWQDNMVIPTDAPHPYTAHVFINYLLDPEIGAMLTEWTFGFTPNTAVVPLLSDDYYTTMETVGLLVDDETRERLEWVLRGEGAEIFSETWTTLKAE
ncbi:MAG: spermidine/putrescine ABC transporter substrate-binding protein [Chloroflexota bacterium]